MSSNNSQIPDGNILDYASPGMGGPLRLAKLSILTFLPEPNGMHIVETLTGKMQAIYAICFSAISMIILGLTTSSINPRFSGSWFSAMFVWSIFAAGVAALIIALINSNWRATILKILPEHLQLTFQTPFKNRPYQWTWDQFRQVHVTQQLDQLTQRVVCELQIEIWTSPVVRLFNGHGLRELGLIAEEMRRHQSVTPADG
jgi:energy-converting hydrogenase Eha subunit A